MSPARLDHHRRHRAVPTCSEASGPHVRKGVSTVTDSRTA